MTAKDFTLKIIRVRKLLLKTGKSGLNTFMCYQTLSELEKYIKAYGNKWTPEQWEAFVQRKQTEILYLIPQNNAQEKYLQEFKTIIHG
jgi:hypothetical protein